VWLLRSRRSFRRQDQPNWLKWYFFVICVICHNILCHMTHMTLAFPPRFAVFSIFIWNQTCKISQTSNRASLETRVWFLQVTFSNNLVTSSWTYCNELWVCKPYFDSKPYFDPSRRNMMRNIWVIWTPTHKTFNSTSETETNCHLNDNLNALSMLKSIKYQNSLITLVIWADEIVF
jgi:hypothetical protein